MIRGDQAHGRLPAQGAVLFAPTSWFLDGLVVFRLHTPRFLRNEVISVGL